MGDGELPTPDAVSTGKTTKAAKATKKTGGREGGQGGSGGGYKSSRRQEGTNVWLWVGVGALLLVAVIVGGIIATRGKKDPPPDNPPEQKHEQKHEQPKPEAEEVE